MITLDALRAMGVNVDEGLGRCMNNEMFYLRLAGKALDDAGFAALQAALEAGSWSEAFEQAHRLKGAIGNLSLTPVYEPLSVLTERLRTREAVEYEPLLAEILEKRGAMRAL